MKDAPKADHYNEMNLEPVQVINSLGKEFARGFYLGNVIKYVMRSIEGKPGESESDELSKAQWYLNEYVAVFLGPEENEKLWDDLLESIKNDMVRRVTKVKYVHNYEERK